MTKIWQRIALKFHNTSYRFPYLSGNSMSRIAAPHADSMLLT